MGSTQAAANDVTQTKPTPFLVSQDACSPVRGRSLCVYHYCLVLERRTEHLLSALYDSVGHEVLAYRVWHLHVSPLVLVITTYSCHFPIRSWEFLTTLDFEWSIIRGLRRYRWTIWVRDDSALL